MSISEISRICSVFLFVAIYLCFLFLFSKDIGKTKNKVTRKTLKELIDEKATYISKEKQEKIYINKVLKKKQSILYRIQHRIKIAVYSEYSSFSMTAYLIMTFLFIAIGYYISRVFQNVIASLLFVFIFSVLPYFIVTYFNNKKRTLRDRKLQMVMGNLSISYIRTKTFLEAVEQTIDIIPESLKDKFEFYYRNVMYFHADPIMAMYELRDSIDNSYFHKMMNLAINAEQGEKELKYTILAIPMDYKRYIDINDNFAREVKDSNIGFITVLCCFPLVISFLKVSSEYYFFILTETIIGKSAVSIVILALILIAALFIKFNKPVKIKL